MTHYDDRDGPISVVEDLDPEPPSNSRLPQRLEVLVGVVLLVAVLTFVGWQWWRTQVQTNAYAEGQTALSTSDWDAALVDFTQAGDYRDAAQLAKRAQDQITERDRLYSSAEQHKANGEWLDSLEDIRAAALIQPGYRDLIAQEKTALQNVYTSALSGTIAMRPTSVPPGLYYYTNNEWVYLQGSDEKSSVQSMDTQGNIIYDVPGAPKGSKPLLASPPYMQIAVGNIRYYWVAHPTGSDFTYTALDIDPEHYYEAVLNGEGAWGFSSSEKSIPDGYLGGNKVINQSLIGILIAYQPFSGAMSVLQPASVFTGNSASNIVLAIDPQSDHYLSADYTGADGFAATISTTVRIYANEVGSTAKQLIYTHMGGLMGAQLGPNGRYALLYVRDLASNSRLSKTSTILIDLQNTQVPQLIAENPFMLDFSEGAAFVEDGVFKGDFCFFETDTDSTRVLLIDPSKVGSSDNPKGIIKAITVAGQSGNLWALVRQNNDGIMVLGQNYGPRSTPITPTLTLVNIPAQGDPTASNMQMPNSNFVYNVNANTRTAVWTNTIDHFSMDNMTTVINTGILNTVANSTLDITPTLTFSSTFNSNSRDTDSIPSFSLSDTLLAYTLNGQLHARTYSGSIDISLESDVSSLTNYHGNVISSYWNFLR